MEMLVVLSYVYHDYFYFLGIPMDKDWHTIFNEGDYCNFFSQQNLLVLN